ncbi:zinc finger protein 883-like [Ischnura elegans]|uniref:zinc finger protein 883-like n=1 Tax=Ischnura elegans TaxID=197161 RepID=UPI001ED8B576|nr:zinc finger protein 883-like [Ischnura elegans]
MDPSFKHTLCRLCLFKSERLVDIFGMNGVHGYIAADVIEDLLQFKVTRSDGYPQTVCSSCLDKLTDFKMFKEQCKGSMAAFENGFDPDKFNFVDGPETMSFSPASLVKVEMMMPEAEDSEEPGHAIDFHGHYLDGGAGEMEAKANHIQGEGGGGDEMHWGGEGGLGACQQDDSGMAMPADTDDGVLDASLQGGEGDDSKPFGCGICGRRFARSNKLVQHIRTHTGERPFVCEICGRAFNRKDKLSLHRKTHNAEKPYQCPTCLKRFCRSDYLLTHRKTAHPEEEVSQFPCLACGTVFGKDKDLSAHIRTAHFSCADCDAAFLTEGELAAHAEAEKHNSGQQLDCVDCGKAFEDREKLRRHAKVHDSVYSCEWCGKAFHRMDKLHQHRRTHTNERPYHCDVCGKGFTRGDKLSEHRRTHDSAKRHQCPECGKCFSRGDYLQTHRRKHLPGEEGPQFKCELCAKSFVSKRELVLHADTHSEEKPFACAECGKRFKRKGALNTHRKGLHGVTAEQLLETQGVPWVEKTKNILATYLQAPLAS